MRVFAVLLVCLYAEAFYLPGVAPRDFEDGEPVDIKVNKVDSVKTQLPYDYYSLPFCQPKEISEVAENLGEVLSGDMIQNSPYEVYMQQTETCKILCKKVYTASELKQFAEFVENGYKVNWIVDNIPAATKYYLETDDPDEADVTESGASYSEHYDKGFELGFVGQTASGAPAAEDDKGAPLYLNNHHHLVIYYHSDAKSFQGYRIVAFQVEPFSVNHKVDGTWNEEDISNNKLSTCAGPITRKSPPQPIATAAEATELDRTVIWTYDIKWEYSPIKWASRWDLYLKMTDSQIHWFSIVNSIMIVIFLSGMVAMIMCRILNKDIAKYNEDMSEEDRQEETGWKLIHGEVFRPPARGGLFSIMVGTGWQMLAMSVLTLLFAALGFLSPANRGGLMTAFLVLFVVMGMVAGFTSTRIYNMFKLPNWKRNSVLTATVFPGVFFAVFFILNLFVWGEKSSGAVPFGTLVLLLVLWVGVSVPLVLFGSNLANSRPVGDFPVRVNNIPRPVASVAESKWYHHPHMAILLGGVLPFGAVFIEIYFIMYSVWLHQFYYVFGFLLIVFAILVVTCAEISIVMVYFQLCQEDYHWWWRSFLTSGCSALYLFLYSFIYFFAKLEIVKFVSGLLFFGYMFLVSLAFFLVTGTIGFYATYLFVWKIYASVKID